MELLWIQSQPYSLRHKQYLLSASNIEFTDCFIGSISKLLILDISVNGIFTVKSENKLTNKCETVFIKAFYYNSPKKEFKYDDCPEATDFLIIADFSINHKIFLQKLAYSEINTAMIEPCKDPFLDEYLQK